MSRIDPIQEAKAVTALKESLAALLGEGEDQDLVLLIDSVEGETNFFEAVDRIMQRIADDNALVGAIDLQMSDLKARKDRFKKRAETNKALIEQAFLVADLPKVERPLGTLFLSNRAPKVIIETESEIPARYWKPSDPVLDGKALGDDLKAMRDGLELILTGAPEDRAETVAVFCQRFPDHEQAQQLRDHLAVLDAAEGEEERRNAEAALRHNFGSVPGATLSAGSRSLSIRVA